MSLGAVIYKGRDVRGDVISGWRVLGLVRRELRGTQTRRIVRVSCQHCGAQKERPFHTSLLALAKIKSCRGRGCASCSHKRRQSEVARVTCRDCGSCFEARPSLVSPDWTCESCRRRRSRNGACPDCGKALYQTKPCDHVTHGGEA